MRKMLFLVLALSAFLLQGCSGHHGQFLYKDEDGINIYLSRCKHDIGDCYKGAGEMCTSGFDIIDWKGYKMYGPITVVENEKDVKEAKLVKEGKGKYVTGGGTLLFKCKNNSDVEEH